MVTHPCTDRHARDPIGIRPTGPGSAVHAPEAGPREVAHLTGDLVWVELLAPLDEATAGALGEAHQRVGEGEAVLVVDVGGDQRSDGLDHAVGDAAHRPAELLIATVVSAVQQHDRVVLAVPPRHAAEELASRAGRRLPLSTI